MIPVPTTSVYCGNQQTGQRCNVYVIGAGANVSVAQLGAVARAQFYMYPLYSICVAKPIHTPQDVRIER
eukprot:7911444-Lingulodinium_polyedra.AAC.1